MLSLPLVIKTNNDSIVSNDDRACERIRGRGITIMDLVVVAEDLMRE